MKVLVVGSGGRDHAIAWKFAKSPQVKEVIVAHGNAGIGTFATCIPAKKPEEIVAAAVQKKVDLIFVGPEGPLCSGIVDLAQSQKIPIVGPTRTAARLEGSKCDTKRRLRELGIPVPEFGVFTDPDEAREYVKSVNYPVVVKADGPAKGKGSLVCDDIEGAIKAIKALMVDRIFGVAGERVIIEERKFGRELSYFCATDGKTVKPLEVAQDYKRAWDGDKGKNTGGMGAYSPHPWLTRELSNMILNRVARPVVHGMRETYGILCKGILYFGLMLVQEDEGIVPYVLEVNVRLGDPEAQVILPRLKTDLVDLSHAIIAGTLNEISLCWDERFRLCLIATSGPCKGYKGYPDRYRIGSVIEGIDRVDSECLVFHNGTGRNTDGAWISTGGRVISLISRGNTLPEARDLAYGEMEKIQFKGKYCRTDIGMQ